MSSSDEQSDHLSKGRILKVTLRGAVSGRNLLSTIILLTVVIDLSFAMLTWMLVVSIDESSECFNFLLFYSRHVFCLFVTF